MGREWLMFSGARPVLWRCDHFFHRWVIKVSSLSESSYNPAQCLSLILGVFVIFVR